MPDQCAAEHQKVADLMNQLADNRHQLNDAWGDEAAIELKIAIDTDSVTSATTSRARRNAQARLRRDHRRRARTEESLNDLQATEDSLQESLRTASANLTDCEALYGIEGCGSKGGVGVRRPDGKCAGWEDWKNSDGGYY